MIDYADTVTAMSSGWWAGNASAITEIVIGEGITSVGDYAFYYFTKLAKVTLPSTLKEIGAQAFYDLRKITEIGKKAFFSSGIQTITFPDKLTTIGVEAFNATALKNVTFPASLTTINEKAFMNCASLESVTVANADKTTALNIGPNAFYRCVSLKTLNLSGTGVIRNNAFDGCTSLTTLTLPSTLSGASTSTNSFSNQFKDCTALETVVIEDGAAALGRAMFDGCEKLNSITVPAGVTKTYGTFKDNEFITTAVLNNSEIGNNMFTNAISLSNLTLNGTETIGSNAFQGCAKLTKVTIPDTVDTIGSYAFEKCIGLRSFIFPEAVTVSLCTCWLIVQC